MLTLKAGHRYPVPDWAEECKLAPKQDGDHGALDRYWTERGREWVRLLAASFGEKYRSQESPNFWLICAEDTARAGLILRWAEKAHAHLTAALGDVRSRHYGRIPILAIADPDTYYAYVSEYYADGEHPASGGVYLYHGYGHFAFCFYDLAGAERVITHELMHALLVGLDIPLWLNEGIAQVAEATLLGQAACDFERMQKTIGFWSAKTIEEFWAGTSFQRMDDGRAHSYHLAFILTRKLTHDMPRFRAFVKAVKRSDGGRRALYDAYGISLEELAAEHLGRAPWSGGSDWKIGTTLRY